MSPPPPLTAALAETPAPAELHSGLPGLGERHVCCGRPRRPRPESSRSAGGVEAGGAETVQAGLRTPLTPNSSQTQTHTALSPATQPWSLSRSKPPSFCSNNTLRGQGTPLWVLSPITYRWQSMQVVPSPILPPPSPSHPARDTLFSVPNPDWAHRRGGGVQLSSWTQTIPFSPLLPTRGTK